LKTWRETCQATYGSTSTTINSVSYLVELPCKSVKKEQQWKKKDLHICSNKNDICLAVSGGLLILMPYKASAKSQQWLIGSTMRGLQLIVNVGSSLCLYYPPFEYEKKAAVMAITIVKSCG